jgi:sulfatase maturation enzyme AslB (radical SAM superfamily)
MLALTGLYMTMRTRLKKRDLLVFDVLLCDHCNLNCKGCQVFSPLAPEHFLKLSDYERDIAHLSHLFNGKMEYISLIGGEPLLHPGITEIIQITRKYFPQGAVQIITNGLLLLKQPQKFWESCKENNAVIFVTKYPIKLDIEGIKEKAAEHGVTMSFFWGDDVPEKTFWKKPLDISGKQNAVESFNHCQDANRCIQLRDGRIYGCSTAAYSEFFNQFFNTNLALKESDSIDIHKTDNPNDILNFMCAPKPFCRYCKPKEIVYGLDWAVSKKQIEEWV